MKLLNRTTLNYLLYSVIVLLIITPIFYVVINTLFIKDVDETLLLQKQEIQFRIEKIISTNDLKVWVDLDGDVQIEPANGRTFNDSIFNVTQYDSLADELEPYRMLSSSVSAGGKLYHLTARISLVESKDLIFAIVLTQASALVLLLAGLVIINSWVSKRIWKPFYNTLEKLRQFEVEKTPLLKLGSSSTKEFNDLNNAIEQLADRNYKMYLSQKEFTENAAHEMQTPLAIFQSKLELLMQTTSITEEQAKLMVSLMDSTNRLSKLNKALLLLSKIENNQFIETEVVDVVGLTNKLISVFENQAATNKTSIQLTVLYNLQITFNPTLIDILLSNLLSNALKYTSSKGTISITISNNKWQITNSGDQPIASPTKIYDRFQKGDASQTSTGLGLAIVKKICDMSGGSIQYNHENKTHNFSVTF